MLCRLVVLLFTLSFAQAVNHHVRAGATGSANGTDWTNAYTTLPSTLTRGDTYFIADGSYGSYNFNDSVSGTTIITIQKATENSHGSATGWSSAYGDGQAQWNNIDINTSYLTINGVTGSGKSGHGFKVGPSGGQVIDMPLSPTQSNITITRIELEGNGLGTGSRNRGILIILANNITVSYSYIHLVTTVPFLTGTVDTLTIEYNWVASNDSTPTFHGEAIADQDSDNVIVRYNVFEDIEGTAIITILNRGSGSLRADNWDFYGNVVFYNQTGSTALNISDGVIACINNQKASNWNIHNNTIVNVGPTGLSSFSFSQCTASNIEAFNNLFIDTSNAFHNGNINADFNYYVNTAHTTETNEQTGFTDPLVDWPNEDFHLSVATNDGITLASPYNTDPDGLLRGVDNIWDRGAFELFEPVGDVFVMNFTGLITSITDSVTFLPTEIAVGDTVTGTFCYTTTASDRDTSSEWGDYRLNIAPDTLIFTVESKTWQPTSNFTLQVLVRNGASADTISIGLRGINMPVGLDSSENSNHSFMQFSLVDTGSSVFTDDSLPTALTLSDFEHGIIEIAVTHNVLTGDYYRILVETVLTLEAP